jgi:hypothetical protein
MFRSLIFNTLFVVSNKKSWGIATKRRIETPMSDVEAYSR